MRWSVRDVPEAVLSVISWVREQGGTVHGLDSRHLLVELPPGKVVAFLQQFSDAGKQSQPVSETESSKHASLADAKPAAALSPVTLTLELVPLE